MQVSLVTSGVQKAISATFSMCSRILEMLSLVLTEIFLPSLHRPLLPITLAVEDPFIIFLDVSQATGEGVEIEVERGVERGAEREVGGIVQGPQEEGVPDLLDLVDQDGDTADIVHDQRVGHGHGHDREGKKNRNHRNPGESTKRGTIDLDLDLCRARGQ